MQTTHNFSFHYSYSLNTDTLTESNVHVGYNNCESGVIKN